MTPGDLKSLSSSIFCYQSKYSIFADQMKKFLVLTFVLFYFSVASGATVEFHYCMGKLVEWGMAQPSESKACSNCKMSAEDSKDCCKKDQQEVKIEKAQKAQFSFQFKSFPSIVVLPNDVETRLISERQINTGANYSHAPPRTQKAPVFLMLRTFRI